MDDSQSSDSEATTRTLLRQVLDSAVPLTPLRPRSARAGSSRIAQKTLLETPSSRSQRSQTRAAARRHSHGARAIDKQSHVQASGNLEDQTPRTLLRNILLTAPESSIVMPESVVTPAPAPSPQTFQPSTWESSWGSLELQLPEIEPHTTLASGLLAPVRKKQRVRLSVFQQDVDHGLPLSQESPGNDDATPLTSSTFNLTFTVPVQSQSVQRPGLARRPLTRRPVDVGAFLQDLQDSSTALLSPDVTLEDTQPFSPPLLAHSSLMRHSLPGHLHTGAEKVERIVSPLFSLLHSGPYKPAQLLAARADVNTISVGSPHTSTGISGKDRVEPIGDDGAEHSEERRGEEEGVGVREGGEPVGDGAEHSEERREDELVDVSEVQPVGDGDEAGVSMSEQERTGEEEDVRASVREVDEARSARKPTATQGEPTEAIGSFRALEGEKPEGASGNTDARRTASPQLASTASTSLQAKRHHQFLEPTSPPHAAQPRTAGPRPRQDPYKAGVSHYAKLFTFYAKMPMEKRALEMVEKCLDRYFQHLCSDLEVYAAHAGRKTVKPEDLELLMRRQGLITDQVSLHVLVERYLPLEYRQLLIPCAFSGNSVFPTQ
ncbi:PREDICTED: centromere protein T [Elephantulus edwardii]|uniref:centromere protein T n=1 Tax=Elephantulus edwardii TaxID=28737 RepID=UPI0003F0BDDA|nr:PREDICTED: centromere protein T [Elephantulus edwardii]